MIAHIDRGTGAQFEENYGTSLGPGQGYVFVCSDTPTATSATDDIEIIDDWDCSVSTALHYAIKEGEELQQMIEFEEFDYGPPPKVLCKLSKKYSENIPKLFRPFRMLDSRSGMKGITTRKKMGRI